MVLARKVIVRGGSADPIVIDLAPSEEPAFTANLTAAATADAAEQAQAANGATLRQRASAALQANAAFLALPAAQQAAQAASQIVRLTRQNSALIRLVLGALDSTADS